MRFTRPSVRRTIGTVAATAIAFAAVAGVVLYANAIVTHSDPQPSAAGEYVRLFFVDVTLWGPMAPFAIWQISLPTILGTGLLTASLRSAPASRSR